MQPVDVTSATSETNLPKSTSMQLWMPPDLRNNLAWCLETFRSILACTTLVLSTFDNGDQLCNQLRDQLTGYQLVTHFSARFRYENQVVIQKKLKPCRILIVDMPRYQVFHLTRSDLGHICWQFFFAKSIRLMYLLFNGCSVLRKAPPSSVPTNR